MLHMLKDLEGYAIHTVDGYLGLVKDFYFDDRRWVIRYLVIETGSWLSSKKVLVSPISIKSISRENKTITVTISIAQMTHSPCADANKPISRQFETDYLDYYGYPLYWVGTELWGRHAIPAMVATESVSSQALNNENIDMLEASQDVEDLRYRNNDHYLRSVSLFAGYDIHAKDGKIGHVEGMFIDAQTMAIRYLTVNTGHSWRGHLVLLAPRWINHVSWVASQIYVDLTQQQVRNAPPFDPAVPINRELEKGIHLHYGRDGYWEDKILSA